MKFLEIFQVATELVIMTTPIQQVEEADGVEIVVTVEDVVVMEVVVTAEEEEVVVTEKVLS